MKDESCIFCRIASGEIPSATLYEDADFRVILDLSPASFGHALVLPKVHAENIFALSDEQVQKAFLVARRVAARLKEVTSSDGVNILQNNGTAAGQTVFHFHIHLIPRKENDGVGLTWRQGCLSDADKEALLAAFQHKPA